MPPVCPWIRFDSTLTVRVSPGFRGVPFQPEDGTSHPSGPDSAASQRSEVRGLVTRIETGGGSADVFVAWKEAKSVLTTGGSISAAVRTRAPGCGVGVTVRFTSAHG